MRRLVWAILTLAVAAQLHGCRTDAPSSRPPNVLLIMTDDQGWGDVRSHGNDKIDTPALDRLASQGVRFDRFYVSPLCAPTRASLLTGRYHLRTGTSWVTRGLETMRPDELTVAEALRAAGYATGCFGKWHNGSHYPSHPNGQGFDEFFGFCAGHWNNYFDTLLERNGKPVQTDGYITDVLTDAAMKFIERNRRRPFFCYVPYNAPHSPFQVPDRYFDKYKARGFDDKNATVYGMCENIDDNVERLLKRLDALGLTENTIVIFTTDNGPNTERFNGGMKGRKGSVHEGGVRVPLFVRWTGRLRAGTEVRRIAAHIDLLPTILDLCGVTKPNGPPLDGVSIVPLLRGREEGWPERTIFTHQAQGGGKQSEAPGAARTDRYRLVVMPKGVELYDMVDDPGQKKNVAAQLPEVVKKLKAEYDEVYRSATASGVGRPVIPVGHPESPEVELPAPECYMEGGVKYMGRNGWTNDWVTNWTSTDDRIWWEIDVVNAGRYEVILMHTCPAENVGAKVRAEAAGRSVEGAVTRAYDPEPIPSPDRVPRQVVPEKVWAPLSLGALDLPKGRTRLTLSALTTPSGPVMDLKAALLRTK